VIEIDSQYAMACDEIDSHLRGRNVQLDKE